jgi:hypothetical protein
MGLQIWAPSDLVQFVAQQDRFAVFFPLGAALNRSIFRIAANVPVPENKRAWPVFRSRSFVGGEAGPWRIWNGVSSRRAREGERGTPGAVYATWNDTLLVERIVQDWTPDDDPRYNDIPARRGVCPPR